MLKLFVLLTIVATISLGAACSGLAINPITGLLDCVGASSSGSGTVTSISTTSPLTGGIITDTGTIACATCVTSAASLTNNAIMTGAGSQASKTPAATATMDTSGNISTPGSVSMGVGGSVAGTLELTQGTAPSLGTTSVKLYAPTSVTSYAYVTPAAASTGFMLATNTANVMPITHVAASGTGNVCLTTSCSMTTPALGTPSALVLTNATGLPNASVAAAPVPTPGTSITLAAPRGYAICTGTCTVAVPVPAAGYEFCIVNDDNIATAITLSALGSSAMYENSARTAYGTAGTGTLVVAAAAKNKVCILGRDATHYFTVANEGGAITVN